jgi:hypothetical protein|tara:strand:- start:1648 stop:2118 length:471 start_codon:yes stop_codon:yes gene_type:complete
MNWFDLLKLDFAGYDAKGFLEHLQDTLGGDVSEKKEGSINVFSLDYDEGYIKLRRRKDGAFFVITHKGSFSEDKKFNKPTYNLKKIVDELLDYLQDAETFEKFDIDGLDFSKATPEEQLSWFNSLKAGGAVTTATPAIINVRYSKKKEDEEFGQKD